MNKTEETTTTTPLQTYNTPTTKNDDEKESTTRAMEALKQLFCGGMAGSAAKTVTAPFSRLTILYQVHSMVTTKENRPRFAMSFTDGMKKIVDRGGFLSLWKGNGTSVLHRFPFSAINFYVYENALDALNGRQRQWEGDEDERKIPDTTLSRFIAGSVAGSTACIACYPLDLIRTRITTELPGNERFNGIIDATVKTWRKEGFIGLYSGLGPTLFVAVPNFAISYTVYGTLKEYALDDDLFYNMRRVDEEGEKRLGFRLTLMCGAASGSLSTLVTFPFDTIRRRMQIQGIHLAPEERLPGRQQLYNIIRNEGAHGLYRGLTPELLKVVPMVGTMFLVYEFLKDQLNVRDRKR